MATVRKGGIAIECRDEVQLDAFLNNGWSVVEEAKIAPPLFIGKPVEPADEPQEEKRRGRKKKENSEIG